jgi:hypothetical protein
MSEENKIVPLFKTFEEMQRDEEEILKDFAAEWEHAYVLNDMAFAAIENDETAMAKFAGQPEMALAKAEVERQESKYSGDTLARVKATAALAKRLRAAVEKRDARLYGLSALAKRSMRFASAHARRSYGPGAPWLPPAG